jgi:hypothetical protein
MRRAKKYSNAKLHKICGKYYDRFLYKCCPRCFPDVAQKDQQQRIARIQANAAQKKA